MSRVRKRLRGLVCLSIGTNTKERMIVSRISGVVVWQLMCDNFGDFKMTSAQYVLS